MSGTLYIVATPIGNLADITLRALETLRSVDLVYAEDTRVTQKLLQQYQIKKPLRSYREALPAVQLQRTIDQIITQLQEGNSLAFVSDAGTPGISDPGSYLVEKVVAAGVRVVPIPGVSAFSALVSVSGKPLQHVLFVGFLPKKKGHQTLMRRLQEGLASELFDGIVMYESPARILKFLAELQLWPIELEVCLGRELTKHFEEILRGSPQSVAEQLAAKPSIKGEISIILCRA